MIGGFPNKAAITVTVAKEVALTVVVAVVLGVALVVVASVVIARALVFFGFSRDVGTINIGASSSLVFHRRLSGDQRCPRSGDDLSVGGGAWGRNRADVGSRSGNGGRYGGEKLIAVVVLVVVEVVVGGLFNFTEPAIAVDGSHRTSVS